MKKGIIFDMDGTVWDSSENVAKSWTVKIHEAGYTDRIITRDDIKNVMGKTMDVIADIFFPFTEKGPGVMRFDMLARNMKLNTFVNTAVIFMTEFLIPGRS